MKRCPKCGAGYDGDAAWCPLDGTQLHDVDDPLHTLTEDTDAGHTLRDLASPLTTPVPGALTMGWEIPEVPTTAPGAVIPGPKAGALTAAWEARDAATPVTAKPSSLTMGWEIPDISDEPPRTTPTQLAAVAVPSTLPGVKLKAASLPPAAPRMTPKSLAAALAKAPAPHRPEPTRTPTTVNVPLEPRAFDGGLAETEPFEQVDPDPPQRVSEPIDPPTFATPPIDPDPPTPTIPPLTPPPNLEPRRASISKPPPMRRLITEPMPSVAAPPEPPPEIEVVPPRASDSLEQAPLIEHTAPVEQVSVQLRAPITMPGIVAPEIRTLRKPPSPSDAPPMAERIAIAAQLNQPSAVGLMPPAPERTARWMWLAICLIVIGGTVGIVLALR